MTQQLARLCITTKYHTKQFGGKAPLKAAKPEQHNK